jgi:O-antigen ligase
MQRLLKNVPLEWLSWLIWPVIFLLWQQPLTHYSNVPFWMLTLCLVALLGLCTRVPWLVWAWWGLGAITFFWSLTPGNSFNAALWEAMYVVAFVAGMASGRQNLGFWGLNAILFVSSLAQALALNASGMGLIYFSGSLHYVLGAQALVLVIPLFVLLLRNPGKWMLFIWIATVVVVFILIISGARAVYVPFALLLAWSIWQVWREGVKPLRILMVIGVLVATTVGIDFILPFHPARAVLSSRTTASLTGSDTQEGGGISSRLQMWDQTLGMAFRQPFGTGVASFKDVLPAFQKYPAVLFGNAHNYYVETVATGGWLRLIALVGLLIWVFQRGLSSKHWPVALGILGLWMTLAFDVTGYFPSPMMLAFAGLGLVWENSRFDSSSIAVSRPFRLEFGQFESGSQIISLFAVFGMTAWWFWPCESHQCAFDRHFGRSNEALTLLRDDLKSDQRAAVLNDAERFNPKSVWVWQARLSEASSSSEKLKTLREINQKFPIMNPNTYLTWAKEAIVAGKRSEAIEALELGLRHFPVGFRPPGVPLEKVNWYADWLSEANKMLSELQ